MLPARAEILKVHGFVARGEPIPWRRLYRVPSHVFFSHRRHVAMAGIVCAECHGPMEEQTRPPDRALVAHDMDDCMECHERTKASTSRPSARALARTHCPIKQLQVE